MSLSKTPETSNSTQPSRKNGFKSPDVRKLTDEELLLLEARTSQETTRRRAPLSELEFKTKTMHPVLFVTLSDMHIGSNATDMERLLEIRENILKQKNVFVFLLGDEIEGIQQAYHSTNVDKSLALEEQIKLFQLYLRPLYEANRVICMVGEYFGHVGWANDKSGINAWQHILGDMEDIPIVQNNATVTIVYPNRHKQTFQVMHDPGRKSIKDELHGVRIATIEENSDVGMRGHLHSAGIGAENERDGSSGVNILIGGGTFKGINPEFPRDSLGVRKALRSPGPGGQAVVTIPRTRKQERLIQPFMNSEEGLFTLAALELWNQAERQHLTDELIEEIRSNNNLEEMVIIPQRSRKDGGEPLLDKYKRKKNRKRAEYKRKKKEEEFQQSYWFNESYVTPYNTLGLETCLDLPMSIEPIANLRMGAVTFRKKEFTQYIKDLAQDPYRTVLWLRKLIDPDVSKLPQRKEIIDKLLAYMQQLDKKQNIALLLDASLSNDNWKREIKYSLGFPPGSYLANKSGMPLINNQCTIDLIVQLKNGNKTRIPIVVWDHLMQRGSTAKPTGGLRSLYDANIGGRPRISIGGHMPGSGWSSMYDKNNLYHPNPIFIAPGNWSEWNDMGKSNKMEGGKSGCSVILIPREEDVMVLPVHSFSQRKTLMDATTLEIGLSSSQREAVIKKKGR